MCRIIRSSTLWHRLVYRDSCVAFVGLRGCCVVNRWRESSVYELPVLAAALKEEGITGVHSGSAHSFSESAAYVTPAPKPLFSSLTTCTMQLSKRWGFFSLQILCVLSFVFSLCLVNICSFTKCECCDTFCSGKTLQTEHWILVFSHLVLLIYVGNTESGAERLYAAQRIISYSFCVARFRFIRLYEFQFLNISCLLPHFWFTVFIWSIYPDHFLWQIHPLNRPLMKHIDFSSRCLWRTSVMFPCRQGLWRVHDSPFIVCNFVTHFETEQTPLAYTCPPGRRSYFTREHWTFFQDFRPLTRWYINQVGTFHHEQMMS